MRRRVVRVSLAAMAGACAVAVLGACEPGQVNGGGTAPPLRIEHTGKPTPATRGPAPARATPRPRAVPPDDPKPAAPTSAAPTSAAPASAAPKAVVLMAKGSQSAQVRELQARLRGLGLFAQSPTGYYGTVTAASVTAFQRAHGLPTSGQVGELTWGKLRDLTGTPTHDELYPPTTLPVSKPDKRCLTGRVMCVSKKSRTLAWMVNGRMVAAMDVRFGSEYTPTREGAFTVFLKSRDHVSTIYHTPMPYAMFFSGGQAVHYSADFAARGYAGASHGCVNVRDKAKVSALFDEVRTGDKVVVYN